jgi:cellulose synthase operon protein C
MPYLRTGRLDAARNAHVRAYRAHRHQRADLSRIAHHVYFCGLTGNEARGLELIDRHLDWLCRPPSPYAEMEFACAAAFVLDRADVRGLPFREETAGELADRLAAQARALAVRFDARNGTGFQSRRVEERLSAEPIVARLPLTAVARAAVAVPASPAVPAAARVVEAPSADPAGLLAAIAEDNQAGSGERVGDLLAVLDDLYPTLPPALAARRAEERGRWLANTGRVDEAEADFEAALAGHRAVGDEPRAVVAEARLGLLYCLTGRADEGLVLIERATAYADEHGDPVYRASAHLRRCDALMAVERISEALVEASLAGRLGREGDDQRIMVEARSREAHLLCHGGQQAEALAVGAHARQMGRALGPGTAAAVASFQYGELLLGSGEPAEAAAAFAEALELGAVGSMRYAAHANRGKALSAAGQPAAAIDDLVEAVAGFVSSGTRVPAAYARFDLAVAYHRSGQHLDAAEIAEEAVRALDAIGATDAADRCRYLLSRVYRALDEPDQALAQLEELEQRLDGFDNLAARGQMREETAQIMYARDSDVEAAAAFASAAAAYETAGQLLDQVRALRWHALALRWAGEADAAVAAVGRVDMLAEALPVDDPNVVYERAMIGYDAARVFIGADRIADALDRIMPVAALFRSIEGYGESVQADLLHGEILVRLGRFADGEPVLRTALGAAPRDSDLCRNAAWLLSEALEATGRSDEAAQVRREHGLEPD